MLFRKKRPPPTRAEPRIVALVQDSPLFDAAWYLHRYPEVAGYRAGPLLHFCEYGLFEHRDPGPNFSTRRYLERRPEEPRDGQPPFLRALAEDPDEARAAYLSQEPDTLVWLLERSGLFDPAWYVANNNDVRRAGVPPLKHFLDHGALEQRDPGPGFDTAAYVGEHPDYAREVASPIEHYLRIGQTRGARAFAHLSPEQARAGRYRRWVAAFDDLTDADLAAMRAEAEGLPPVFGLRLPEAGGETGAHGQVGVRWQDAEPGADLAGLPEGAVLLVYGARVRLRPHAAHVLAAILHARGEGDGGGRAAAQAIYADHDILDGQGQRTQPVFKPEMSPEFMGRLPYAGPLAAFRIDAQVRAALAQALDGSGAVPERIARALLALDPARVARAPHPLYGLPEADAIPDYAGYEPVPAAAPPRESLPAHEGPLPRVCLVIPTRDRLGLLKAGIDSLLADTDYPADRFAITVVDNDSVEPETLAYFAQVTAEGRVAVVPSPGAFNFAKICNDGAAATDAEILVFLNNDMTVKRPDWLRRMVGHVARPETGVVGAQLLYPDDAVQHGGTVLGVQLVGAHRMHGGDAALAARLDVTREMVSVTGACLAVRRSVFEAVGGFDPALRVAFNDVKLCIAVHQAGYRNLYVADPLFYHHESISRGHDDSRMKRHRNAREAIYVRERYADILQDDPSYSPNLSLQQVGELAVPPRRVRPWRRARGAPRILLLSCTHDYGSGVAMVLAQQAAFLVRRGFEVHVGGASGPTDIAYPGCTRVPLAGVGELAAYAVSEAMDAVVAHTPPHFSLARYLGRRPLFYAYDHGEPFPYLFANREEREGVDWEKRVCVAGAKRVFTISQAIHDQQYRADAIVVRNGNGHLSAWDADHAARRAATRERLGLTGRFVVLNVCRFGYEERFYKGVEPYIELAQQVSLGAPDLAERALFVLAGRGKAADVAYVEEGGVRVFADIPDDAMIDLYAAADLYVNLSRWEGYNLGIGQARAMGLPVIASDIPAHREFGIPVSDSGAELARLTQAAFRDWREDARGRTAWIESWDVPLARFAEIIEDDVARDRERIWLG